MTNRLLPLLILILFYSCREQSAINEFKLKEINLGSVKLDCPANFTFSRINGLDSYTAYLVDPKKDTFELEYGKRGIINSLYTASLTVLSFSQMAGDIKFFGRKPRPDEAVYSDYPAEDKDIRIFESNYYIYDTVNSIIMKIAQPKRIGKGITGVYIPNLKEGNSFSMYATNLDSATHMIAIKMFRSIKYK